MVEEEVKTTKYLVELWNFRATDISPVKNGTSNVYIRINFDHYKLMRTNTAKKSLSPRYKCSFDFMYETRFPQKLYVKSLQLEVWHRNAVKKDVRLGRCAVDLQTIANGSYNYDLQIRKSGNRAGHLQFCCSMVEVGKLTAEFAPAKVTTVDEGDYQIKYFFNVDREHKRRSQLVENTNELEFARLKPVKFEAGVRSLFTESLVILLRRGKPHLEDYDKHFGVARIFLHDYMDDIINGKTVHVSADFKSPVADRVVGHFEGDMVVNGCPKTAQLMGSSKCLDDGIHGGYKMFPWMADPPKWQEPELGPDGQPKYLVVTKEETFRINLDDDDDDLDDRRISAAVSVSKANLTTTTTEPRKEVVQAKSEEESAPEEASSAATTTTTEV